MPLHRGRRQHCAGNGGGGRGQSVGGALTVQIATFSGCRRHGVRPRPTPDDLAPICHARRDESAQFQKTDRRAPDDGRAEVALLAGSVVHNLCYCAYVWLAARAGAVFAAQTSYIVTGTGVIWAMVILGERFSPWVWTALCVMLLGLFLVQPRAHVAKAA